MASSFPRRDLFGAGPDSCRSGPWVWPAGVRWAWGLASLWVGLEPVIAAVGVAGVVAPAVVPALMVAATLASLPVGAGVVPAVVAAFDAGTAVVVAAVVVVAAAVEVLAVVAGR